MYPIGKVWLNVCSQADDGKSNAGDMQGRSQCREEKNEKDMYLDIYIYGTPCAHEKGRLSRGGLASKFKFPKRLQNTVNTVKKWQKVVFFFGGVPYIYMQM